MGYDAANIIPILPFHSQTCKSTTCIHEWLVAYHMVHNTSGSLARSFVCERFAYLFASAPLLAFLVWRRQRGQRRQQDENKECKDNNGNNDNNGGAGIRNGRHGWIGRILALLGGAVHLMTAYHDQCPVKGVLSIRGIGNLRRRRWQIARWCWRSLISVLVLILTLVSTGRGCRIHLASKNPSYLL